MSILALSFSFIVSAKDFGTSDVKIIETGANSFSTTQSYDFVVSGGDIISSSSPIVAYVSVEGIYEGGGSVTVYYDGDMTTAETFILPDSGEPETLHLILGDKNDILKSTEAGEFTHQLFLEPQGVTISGVSAHVVTSYARDTGNSCPEGLATSIKSKTIELWVASSAEISSPQTFAINYSIDDNLDGITDPISSAYLEVVGLHNSSAVVNINFENEIGGGVSHELKNVKKQKQFTILSNDISSLIKTESGDGYVQNVTINPNGATISSISMRFFITYRYHPGSIGCGAYPASGTYISPVLDTGVASGVAYNSIAWRGSMPEGIPSEGKVRFQIATAPCSNGSTNPPSCNLDSWKYIGGSTCSISDWFEPSAPGVPYDIYSSGCSSLLDGNQYYRYKVELCSKDCVLPGIATPIVLDIYLSWSP
jgi:hypothetical protein